MLRFAAFLIALAYCSDADPMLWGSRIVGTPKGPSPTMYFLLPKDAVISVVLRDGNVSRVNIDNGECRVGEKVLGRPCEMNDKSANITVNDVMEQEGLHIWGDKGLFSSVLFVPNCTFQKPEPGEVDLQASYPLSRFQLGQPQVELKFAVGGANNQSQVDLKVNGRFGCRWEGTDLLINESSFCRNLSINSTSDERTFALNFTRNDTLNYTTFHWYGENKRLSVTVDWAQGGESPEVAACNGYQGKIITKPLETEMTHELEETTSSGPMAMLTLNALLASLLMTTLLRMQISG